MTATPDPARATTPPNRTAAVRAFLHAGRRAPQLWRLVLGCILIAICAFGWTLAPVGIAWLWRGPEAALAFAQGLQRPETPRATLILLGSFAGMAAGVALAVWLLHRRRPRSLFGPRSVLWRDFALSAGVVLAVYAVGVALWLTRFTPDLNLDPGRWLWLVPLALAGVALQTLAEELVFRGYLTQQLAARFQSPVIWLILPALAFGAVHYDPATAGASVWVVVGSATVFGLVAADLTRRTGSLGAAWGFHFANNLLAILVLATKGTITGLSLFVTPYAVDDAQVMQRLVLGDMALLLVAWAILRRVLR
ncbi:CPBP family intramembrane glutamic endopeptidase [Oceaniglobus trochenteri]|uniref:CPBP family intramembrane glutamic endopeptidase n=1 Tax=Oceaniglobus trochenteri TaxID=2763260 RepID=UPI001CFFF048|nr:type II CAAX endopeptidase family protein [Oceaniglobus trochenteri]